MTFQSLHTYLCPIRRRFSPCRPPTLTHRPLPSPPPTDRLANDLLIHGERAPPAILWRLVDLLVSGIPADDASSSSNTNSPSPLPSLREAVDNACWRALFTLCRDRPAVPSLPSNTAEGSGGSRSPTGGNSTSRLNYSAGRSGAGGSGDAEVEARIKIAEVRPHPPNLNETHNKCSSNWLATSAWWSAAE